MVETVEAQTYAGATGIKKVLFLHNDQAKVYTQDNIPNLLKAFELPKPQLVIYLMPTTNGLAHEHHIQSHLNTYQAQFSSIIDEKSAAKMELELTLFMRDQLIPMAVDSRAYIVVSMAPGDELAAALGRALKMVRSRFGATIPFTIIGVDCAIKNYHCAIADDKALTSQVCAQSTRWSERLPQFATFWEQSRVRAVQTGTSLYECAGNTLGLSPLPELCDAMILVDGLDISGNGAITVDRQPLHQLQGTLVSALSDLLPCVALRCCSSTKQKTGDLLEMRVPVVYINSRHLLSDEPRITADDAMHDTHTAESVCRVDATIEAFQAHVQAVRKLDPRGDGRVVLENWDCATLALFNEALFHGCQKIGPNQSTAAVYLFEAISRAKKRAGASEKRHMVVSEEQLYRVIDCIMCNEMYNYCVMHNISAPAGTYKEMLTKLPISTRDHMQEQYTWIYSVLTSKFFYSGNVENQKGLQGLLTR